MNRIFSNLLLVLILITTAGCDTVMTSEPLGHESMELDPEEWNGKWI